MELKIYSPAEDGFLKAIEWNHDEIKKEVAEKVSYYANLVYTDDQIKEAKADRAKLNKFVQALENKRKEVKKQCLAPYEDFEKKMKEIVAIVNEPIKMIDGQVKGYEEQKKAEKLEEIREYWNRVTSPDHPLTLERVMDPKWLNATVSIKSVQEAINNILAKYAENIATLQNLPDFSFEAIEVYKSTLDFTSAVREVKRLYDLQERKAEAERQAAERRAKQERLKAEAEEARKAEEFKMQCEADDAADIQKKLEEAGEPEKQWIAFKALLSTEDALALKGFFNSRQIEFKAV